MLPDTIRVQIAGYIIRLLVPLSYIASLVAITFVFITAPWQLWRLIPPVLFITLITPAWFYARKSRPVSGIPFILLGFTVPILAEMIFNGGIRAPVFIGVLPILTIIYCLYGRFKTILYLVSTLIIGAAFVVLESKNLLPQTPQPPGVLVLIVYGIWLVFALFFISVPVKMMFDALGFSEKKRLEAEEAVTQKESAQRDLQKSESFRKRIYESSYVPIIVMDLDFACSNFVSEN